MQAIGAPGTTYGSSEPYINWRCDCHPKRVAGSAKRTGLHYAEGADRPVYRVSSFLHPEVEDVLTLLLLSGMMKRL